MPNGIATGGRNNQGFQIKGARELIRTLEDMGKGGKVAAVLRGAVRDGMKVTRVEAAGQLASMESRQEKPQAHKAYPPRSRGLMLMPGYAARHILMEVFISKDKQAAKAVVGPIKEAFYASAFVEFGVPAYGIPARPWLVPAFEDNRRYAENEIGRSIAKRVTKLAQEGRRRSPK